MVLSWLLPAAVARPPALLAVPAGATAARLAAEQELRRRGWPIAAGPAEAAVLVVCGEPGPGLASAADRVWGQLPAPKARAQVAGPAAAPAALAAAQRALADLDAQRLAAHEVSTADDLPMAERGPDRDGLALDRLHLALGPVLPDWPAGLALHLTVQGDVVQQARAECLDGGGRAAPAYWDEPWRRAAAGEPVGSGEAARRALAARLDSLARLLAVAGWDGAALAGRRLRDQALTGATGPELPRRLSRFHRRVAGSRLFRWMTRGLGRLDSAGAAGFGAGPPGAASDVTDRAGWWLAQAGQAADRLEDPRPLAGLLDTADPLARPPHGEQDPAAALPRLAELVTGTELAATRLVVASLDPDLDPAPIRSGHG